MKTKVKTEANLSDIFTMLTSFFMPDLKNALETKSSTWDIKIKISSLLTSGEGSIECLYHCLLLAYP
ncbi:MAG: hypothetical protein ABDH16_07305 [Thermodesulfovibrionaceae bacterium]